MPRVYRIPGHIWIDYPIEWLAYYMQHHMGEDVVAHGETYNYSEMTTMENNTEITWAVLKQQANDPITYKWIKSERNLFVDR